MNALLDLINGTGNQLVSECMPPGHKSVWVQQGVEYTVMSLDSEQGHSFEKCYTNVLKTVEKKFLKFSELASKQIYAFSYFYDRLNSAQLLPDGKKPAKFSFYLVLNGWFKVFFC
jgi:hypothetical protein